MGMIKLPKSLLKVLFPSKSKSSSKKKSSSSSVGSTVATATATDPRTASQYDYDEVCSSSSPASTPPGSPDVKLPARYDEFRANMKIKDDDGERPTAGGSPDTVATTLSPTSTWDGEQQEMPLPVSNPTSPVGSLIPGLPSPLADMGANEIKDLVDGQHLRLEQMMPSSPISKLSAFERVQPQPHRAVAHEASPDAASPASPSNPNSKAQFSSRGEEARRRAVARQKRILANASLRLHAISDTSLENIQEAWERQRMSDTRGEASEKVSESRSASGSATPSDLPESRSESPDDGASGSSDSNIRQSPSLESEVVMERPSVSSMIMFYESPVKDETDGSEAPQVKSELSEEAPKKKSAEAPDAKKEDDADPNSKKIQFFVLLLCPTSRIFELIEISAADSPENRSTVQDVIGLIPSKCTDERLLKKKYVGFVRPSDRVDFMDLNAKAFSNGAEQASKMGDSVSEEDGDCMPSIHSIHEYDILVAVLEGYEGYQMCKISKPILKNSKFREMIRRRCKRGGKRRGNSTWENDEKSSRSNRSKRSGRSNRSSRSRKSKSSRRSKRRSSKTPVVDCVPEEIGFTPRKGSSVASFRKSSSLSIIDRGENMNEYSSLCQKLEHLSKKLNEVDDEILAGDVSVAVSQLPTAIDEDKPVTEVDEMDADEEVHIGDIDATEFIFKMTPKMVAYELAANIEDIFAGHDVQIVAVDAEDDNDSDDDTFATARSSRTNKSMRSMHSLVRGSERTFPKEDPTKPLLEITTTKKTQRKPRKSRPSKFESFEEDDMMLQIEAMARQADAAFESRKNKPKSGLPGTAIIEPSIESAAIVRPKIEVIDEAKGDVQLNAIDDADSNEQLFEIIDDNVDANKPSEQETTKEMESSSDAEETIENDQKIKVKKEARVSFNDETDVAIVPPIILGEDEELPSHIADAMTTDAMTTYTSDAISRNFLNTSTSMVSTMVAESNGRVNEVHVLQYLGVTIVCIAANFMQERAGNPKATPLSPGGRAKEVFQSAMFLAFMVNNQKYLAKVTKK